MKLKTYWFEFETDTPFNLPPGIMIGCGVTAYNYEDAIRVVNSNIFKGCKMPPIKRMIENVNINELDHGHVVPNMKPMKFYCVWFPIGYD